MAPADAAGKPKHDLQATGKEIGNTDKFLAYGKITTFPSGKIKILRKVGTGGYKAYKKIKTKANGKFNDPHLPGGQQADLLQGRGAGRRAATSRPQSGIGCIVSA